MSITASMVKELRERTGAGMMECKKALVAAEGDIDKAIEEMRKAGQAKADKKAGRTAAEGIVIVRTSDDGKKAMMAEINSETDFVARDANFMEFANLVVQTALEHNITDVDALNDARVSDKGETIEQLRQALVAKIGENIKVRRIIEMQSEGVIGQYVHGNRIGVLVDLKSEDGQLAKDIAMHVAASRPLVVNKDDVPQSVVDKEREIFSAQAAESGKPAEIVQKMVEGRINKFLDEVSLMGQAFVKDPSTKVSQLLKGANAEVARFVRIEVGEGIEKKEDNFVEEVMAQVRDA